MVNNKEVIEANADLEALSEADMNFAMVGTAKVKDIVRLLKQIENADPSIRLIYRRIYPGRLYIRAEGAGARA